MECAEDFYLNNTTKKWQLWSYGEYYDSTLDVCQDCSDRCSGKCKYQSSCFSCSADEYFDLEQMKCVNEWIDSLPIINSYFNDIPICRSYNYYVDPESNEITELGTIDYPYKHLGKPFVEIYNFHAHSNATINVYVKENTDNFIELNKNIIVNITQVNLSSYSKHDPANPNRASIIAKELPVNMNSNTTVFDILKDYSLKRKSYYTTF